MTTIDLPPPGPTGFTSSIGNLLALRRDAPKFLLKLARDHGGAASFRVGGRRIHFFTDPEAVREVLVTKGASLRKAVLTPRVWKLMTGVLGNGLITSDGAFHDRQRRLVMPAFHRERLVGYATSMTEASRAQTAGWTDGGTLDLSAELSTATIVSVARSLFGADVSSDSSRIISNAVTRIVDSVERMRYPFYRLTAGRAMAQYEGAKAELEAAVTAIIDERRRSGTDRGDLLSVLLLARDEETGDLGMDDQQVRDEVMTFLIAGHDTTTSAMTSSFHFLGRNPDTEARLHAEVDAVLPDGRPPTMADLPRLVYTRQVFTEAMRLYPPGWAMLREVTKPVEIAGWKLPVGALCLISPYVMHRNPHWFPEPERFLPERWEEGQSPSRPKHAYIPFSSGSRSCAGEAFAWMEGTLILADIERHWSLRAPEGAPLPVPLPAFTMRFQHGLQMVTHRRK